MALLLETPWSDLVIDLDLEGSPELAKNVLKLAKVRQYTQSLIFKIAPPPSPTSETPQLTNNNVVQQHQCRVAYLGCPRGDGSGGASIHAYLSEETSRSSDNGERLLDERVVEISNKRFLKSIGQRISITQLRRGDVIALEINGLADTVGSQFGIVVAAVTDDSSAKMENNDDDDADNNNNNKDATTTYPNQSSGASLQTFLSLGRVEEDEGGVLDKLAAAFCDSDGRPLADIRIRRALVVDDPFDDPPTLLDCLRRRGIVIVEDFATTQDLKEARNDEQMFRRTESPPPLSNGMRPPFEIVPERIPVQDIEDEVDERKLKQREEEALRQQDKGRAVVLEMLGDLPDADIQAPEDVLFICKLNPVTQDEDLELIFSRFDPKVKVEIIRDYETGASLQYAFAEFTEKQHAVEAYFKMNNALVDDRRIKVDFSQSVAKIWDKYHQRLRKDAPRAKMPRPGPGGSFPSSFSHPLPSRQRPSSSDTLERTDHDNSRGGQSGFDDRHPRFSNNDRDRRNGSFGRGPSRLDRHETHSRNSSRYDDGDEFGRSRHWEDSRGSDRLNKSGTVSRDRSRYDYNSDRDRSSNNRHRNPPRQRYNRDENQDQRLDVRESSIYHRHKRSFSDGSSENQHDDNKSNHHKSHHLSDDRDAGMDIDRKGRRHYRREYSSSDASDRSSSSGSRSHSRKRRKHKDRKKSAKTNRRYDSDSDSRDKHKEHHSRHRQPPRREDEHSSQEKTDRQHHDKFHKRRRKHKRGSRSRSS